jgi:hypothetical protein
MPSDDFFRSVQAILKMPADDLPYLYGVITERMRTLNLPVGQVGESLDVETLTKRVLELLQSKVDLTGWETALMAAVVVQFGGFGDGAEDSFDSRAVTSELRRYAHRSIANITSAMDSLRERSFVEATDSSKEKGAHKSYRINHRGLQEASKILDRSLKSAHAA